MPTENKVVLTSSIVAEIDPNRDKSVWLNEVSWRLTEVLRQAFADGTVEPTNAVHYHWLTNPETNCGRCESCGRLVSDQGKEKIIQGMIPGITMGGELLCMDCVFLDDDEEPDW